MRKPFYKEQMVAEQKAKDEAEIKELQEMTRDALRDPM